MAASYSHDPQELGTLLQFLWMLVFSVSSAWVWLVFSVLADPNTTTTVASPQENITSKADFFPLLLWG